MTARGAGVVAAAGGAAAWGWQAQWPELVALGAGGLALVAMCLLATVRRPSGAVEADQAAVSVVRGQPATVGLRADLRGARRWSRVVDGPVGRPRMSVPVPRRRDAEGILRLPVDTQCRGQRPLGPYSLVFGDPWGIVRRVVASSAGGVLTVRPRAHRVRRSVTASFREGDADVASRRSGDQHFHALRDYVLGDEPRSVHWRSSARAGKLVVRQQVSAAATGTTVVLDVDSSAYVTGVRFGVNFDEGRFETAVEVAASLATSQLARSERVHLVTTARGAKVSSAAVGAASALLDVLAVVQAVPPVDTAVDELVGVVRRTRAAHTVVVTSAPAARTTAALGRLAREGRLTVVQVAPVPTFSVPAARVVTVADAAGLDEL